MKKIVLEIERRPNKKARGRIQFQTHRGPEFAMGNEFVATDGFILKSCTNPALDSQQLYVRGERISADNTILEFLDEDHLERVKKAVREYNKTFSDGNVYEVLQ